MKTEIQQAEEEAREEALAAAVRRRELAEALFPWMFVFPLATWIGWYLLFLQHGKRHQVRPNVPSGHLPEQDPLFARWVRHRAVGGETLVATLFDLARRGYFNIREEQPETARAGKKKNSDYHFEIQRKSPAELRPFEKDLIDFVSTQVGDSRGFRISNLKRFAKKHQSRFQKWFRNWSKSFKVEAAGENIFEPYPLGPMVLNLLLGLSVVIVGAVVCILTSSPTGLPAIILGALQMIFTTFLSRRTPEGQRLFQEWTNFRKHVRNGDLVRLQLQEHWDTALIAALSLGLVKKFNLVLEHANPDILIIPWFDSANGDVTGIAGISSSIQSMVSTVSSTTTSAAGAAGAGAAASGGGGGGAG